MGETSTSLRRWVRAALKPHGQKAKLARHLGEKQNWVSDYLSGKKDLRLDDLDRIATYFETTSDQLIATARKKYHMGDVSIFPAKSDPLGHSLSVQTAESFSQESAVVPADTQARSLESDGADITSMLRREVASFARLVLELQGEVAALKARRPKRDGPGSSRTSRKAR